MYLFSWSSVPLSIKLVVGVPSKSQSCIYPSDPGAELIGLDKAVPSTLL